MPESNSQRGDGGERALKARSPGEILAEVVRLVDDHQRVPADLRGPSRGIAGDARVGDRDTVEVARRARPRRRRVATARRASPPPPPTGASAASWGTAPPRAVTTRRDEQLAGELERGAGLARAGGGRDQERAALASRRGARARGCCHSRSDVGKERGQRARHPAARHGRTAPRARRGAPLSRSRVGQLASRAGASCAISPGVTLAG